MSEAAKPADPERALAELERMLGLYEAQRRAHMAWSMDLVDAAPWLLPLARAGLYAKAIEVREINHVLADSAALERYATLLRQAEAERDALRAEFAACVRALAWARRFGWAFDHHTACRRTPCTCGYAAQEMSLDGALAQPLAAAVLRSPEPATPADGGA